MRVRTVSAALVLIASTVVLAQGRSDQRPGETPQFRAGVELIQLDVAVLDNKREPVRGLTASDFTVLDNGVETPIRAFTPVELAPRIRTSEAPGPSCPRNGVARAIFEPTVMAHIASWSHGSK